MKKLLKSIATALVALCLPTLAMAGNPSDWPKKLTFGLFPTESSSHMTERWSNLHKYLEKRLGMPVELKVSTDYNGVITAMQFKHIDIAYFGPKSYVEAAQRANAECFAIEVAPDGSKGYHSLIIAKKGSPVTSMQAAKGKTFAFVDPNSTSGMLVPTVYFMKEMKIDPANYFSKVIFSGSHEASMLAVKGGKVDLAAVSDIDMRRGDGKFWERDKDFTVLWTSKLIPGSNMAYRKDLPESLKKALKDAFLAYNDEAGLKQLKIKQYAAVSDDVYDPIREQIEVKKKLSKK